MKTLRILSTVFAAVMLAMMSCAPDTDPAGPKTPAQPGEEVTVNFNYTVEGMAALEASQAPAALETPQGTTALQTRVAPTDLNETTPPVGGIWIIQFSGTATNSPMLGAPRYVQPSGSTFPAALLTPTPATTVVNTIFVANAPANYTWPLLPDAPFSEVVKAVERIGAEGETFETQNSAKTLLMSAVVQSVIDPGVYMNVNFRRNVSKVTLSLKLSNADMTIKSVRMRNVSNRIAYADQAFDVSGMTFPQDFTPFDYAAETVGMPQSGETKTFSWYVPRNMQGVRTGSTSKSKNAYAPMNATYIEILATKGGAAPSTSIFRIYPGANQTDDFNLKGNTHYTYALDVKDIGVDPADTRIETFSALVDHTADDDGRRANSFIVNPAPAGTGITRTYRIPVSQVNNYWSGTAQGYGNTPANTIGAADPWTVSLLWVDRTNLFGAGRIELVNHGAGPGIGTGDGYFEITVPAADVLTDGGKMAGNFVLGLKKGNPASGDFLWSWHFWVTDYNPDEFNRAAAPLMRTNSIYTAPVPGGQIERYAGANWTQPNSMNADRVMMDRSLGAVETNFSTPYDGGQTSRGILHYQFGRKDPFPAAARVGASPTPFYTGAVTSIDGKIPIAQTVANPGVFNTIASGNWTTDELPTTVLWNDPAPSLEGKSIYDPCPPGWQMPRNGTWSDFTTTATTHQTARDLAWATGRGIDNIDGTRYWPGTADDPADGRIWYPAMGHRNPSTGGLSHIGSTGYYWSTMPNDAIRSFVFSFNGSVSSPSSASSRGFGFSVRCISELP